MTRDKRAGLRRQWEKGKQMDPVTEINIIPVIDVSLVLLVILFVSSPFLSFPSLSVKLPQAYTGETREKSLLVTYTLKGELALGSQNIGSFEEFRSQLENALKQMGDVLLILRIDQQVPYAVVERLMEVARSSGAKRVAIGTEQRQKPGKEQVW